MVSVPKSRMNFSCFSVLPEEVGTSSYLDSKEKWKIETEQAKAVLNQAKAELKMAKEAREIRRQSDVYKRQVIISPASPNLLRKIRKKSSMYGKRPSVTRMIS